MRPSPRVAWVLGALPALAGGACSPQPRAAAAPPPPEYRRVPLGLCEDYPEESRSLAGARRDFELLKAAGIDSLRVSLGWDGIEPEPDRHDLDFWDEFVRLAVDDYGLTLLPYVAYTPAWSSAGGEADHWKTPPREPEEFAEIVGLLAQRYRGHIHSWELWNEPDNRDYWLGSVADYARLAALGAAAVRAVDPGLQVVSGGLAGRVEFLAELFDEQGAASHFDVVNLHAYYETWNPEPIETLTDYVEQAHAVVARHGGQQALWMAEIGYGNYRDGARVSAYTRARYAHEHTPEFQAVALVRSLALLLASPHVSRVAWYELKDPPASDAMIGDVNNRHLGVAFADHTPKPAFHALGFMNRLFEDGFRVVTDRLRVEHAGGSRDPTQLHAFETPRGTWVFIAWLPSPAGARTGPAASEERGDAVDDRRSTLHVWAPVPLGSPSFHDALGRPRPAPRAAAGASLALELRGGDVQVVEVPVREP